jgi:serine/threonine-protein kinase HipA
MKKARIYVNDIPAGILTQFDDESYEFLYDETYEGAPISLTMPVAKSKFHFENFPPFFEGLLPEANMLEALLRKYKIDRNDYFTQLVKVGSDVVGAVTIEAII